jgi:hypothetical protein
MRRFAWPGWGLGLLVLAAPLMAQEGRPPPVELGENFPDPFWPTTTIPFTLNPELCRGGRRPQVSLRIFNVFAQEVATPVLRGTEGVRLNGLRLSCSRFLADWDGEFTDPEQELSPGVYLYVLTVDGRRHVGKMIARAPPSTTP